jgi:hypothetical protein
LESLLEVSHGRFYGTLLVILSRRTLGSRGNKSGRNEHSYYYDLLHEVLLFASTISPQGVLRPQLAELLFGEARRANSTRMSACRL